MAETGRFWFKAAASAAAGKDVHYMTFKERIGTRPHHSEKQHASVSDFLDL